MAPFLLLLFSLLLQPSSAADRLRPGESITSNQTLLSGTGAFTLGFFSPSNSTSTSYLGIWVSGSDVRTAVWVANREAPVPLSRATFRLSSSSNLEVADSNGTLLWSSGTNPSNPLTAVTVLRDTGDLVLLSREGGVVLWQSFDHPTDTILPGMPIWGNYKTHTAATAISWRSPVDPSPGEYNLSVDTVTPLQFVVMKKGSGKWARSNVWDGVSYTTRGTGRVFPYLSLMLEGNWWNMSLTSSTEQITLAGRLDTNGTLGLGIWVGNTKVWYSLYKDPTPCATYGLCGAFGYCSLAPPTCRCLGGFQPRNRSEWDGGDYKGGCVRTRALACDGKDELVRFEKMKVPDYNTYLRDVRNENECREACRSNCSCMAYAYADLRMISERVPRCLVWGGGLLDLVQRNDSSGEDLYVKVRMNWSTSDSKNGTKALIVIVPSVAGGACVAAVVVYLIWKCNKGARNKGEDGRLAIKGRDGVDDIYILNEFNSELGQGRRDVSYMDYGIILSATNNFCDENIIGQGGYGTVYKGRLSGGQEVAIKRLCEESNQGLEEFKSEVAVLAKLQHRNLVKLLNCCIHGEEKLLIYEYMPNKSLELLLFGVENQSQHLEWCKRFSIIKGIARGILYLHEDSRLKIIHRDLKASNILLDEDMNPKISDFGMARIFHANQSHANTKRVVGTYGYMSPEYAMEGLFSAKSDVYSFGVLILEIITGQRNTSFRSHISFSSLLSYAWECWNNGNSIEMVDPSIRDSCSLPQVAECAHIGLLCVQDDPGSRPNMSSVVFMLDNDTPVTSTPAKPSFTGLASQDDSTRHIHKSAIGSLNLITISIVEGI